MSVKKTYLIIYILLVTSPHLRNRLVIRKIQNITLPTRLQSGNKCVINISYKIRYYV